MSTTKDVDTLIEFLREMFVTPTTTRKRGHSRKNSNSSTISNSSVGSVGSVAFEPKPAETFAVQAPPRVTSGCCSLS